MVKETEVAEAVTEKVVEAITEKIAKIPKCEIQWREGKGFIVCATKSDQKLASEMVIEGVVIEVRPDLLVKKK